MRPSEGPSGDPQKDRVSRLPAGLRRDLGQAIRVADLDAALAVLGRIALIDAGAAADLRFLAEKFNYHRILELLEPEVEDE